MDDPPARIQDGFSPVGGIDRRVMTLAFAQAPAAAMGRAEVMRHPPIRCHLRFWQVLQIGLPSGPKL